MIESVTQSQSTVPLRIVDLPDVIEESGGGKWGTNNLWRTYSEEKGSARATHGQIPKYTLQNSQDLEATLSLCVELIEEKKSMQFFSIQEFVNEENLHARE